MNTPKPYTLLPDPEQMQAALAKALPHFQQLDWVASTSSTNAQLLAKARSTDGQLARPWLLGAHVQEEGRGRAGRTWQNRTGANLMFSCAFDVFLPPQHLPTLSPLAGLVSCEVLRKLISPANQPHLAMKWPNDIQWKTAKLAGILVEVTRSGAARLSVDHHIVIIGIGINLNDARALSQSLNRQVADWDEVIQADPVAASTPLADIVASIAQGWYQHLNHVTAHGFTNFPEQYAAVDALAGLAINVLEQDRIVQAGIACGVNTWGQLLVKHPAGISPITVGEISVRPQQAV